MNTMIGQQIKYILLILISFLVLGCPKEFPVLYRFKIKNDTNRALFLHRTNREFIPNESVDIYSHKLLPKQTRTINGKFDLESELNNPVEVLLNGWGGGNRIRIYENSTLIVDWRGPVYFGGEADHHFYNINTWDVDEHSESSDVIYTITFTIYPEDLEQDEAD